MREQFERPPQPFGNFESIISQTKTKHKLKVIIKEKGKKSPKFGLYPPTPFFFGALSPNPPRILQQYDARGIQFQPYGFPTTNNFRTSCSINLSLKPETPKQKPKIQQTVNFQGSLLFVHKEKAR